MGMYRDPPVKAGLKPSPSLQHNNLCSLGVTGLAYVHNRCVAAVESLPSTSGATADVKRVDALDSSRVQTVASCTVGEHGLVVLGNGAGMQVWDESGTSLLYTWQLPRSRSAAATTTHADFVRGASFCLAADGSACLCVGTSSGALHAFHVAEGPMVRYAGELPRHHRAPVLALGSGFQSRRGEWAADLGSELVSSDEAGQVAVWEAAQPGAHRLLHSIDCGLAPCVSLAVRGGFIVCGILDGSVRLHGLADGRLHSEIVAHSRWLSGLDIHPARDVIATCSEDSTLAVWALPIKGAKAANLLSACWLNAPLTGVAFCGPGADSVAAVAYDTDELAVWRMSASVTE